MGYNVYGMTWFQIRTDRDSRFSRGALRVDDTQRTVEFTKEQPIVGGYGYDDVDRLIMAIGFYTHIPCPVNEPSDDLIDQTDAGQTDESQAND